jgi:hypothetical protein
VFKKNQKNLRRRCTLEERNHDQKLTSRHVLHKKLDAAGWGLFFIWVGIALFAHVGWGAGLFGVGIIILGGQVVRNYFGLKLEGFWVVAGFLFVLGGVWELFNVPLDLVPILCIVAGGALLVSMLVRKPGDSELCRLR